MSEARAPHHAGQPPPEQIRLIVDRLELVAIEWGLKCWQAELQKKQIQATPGSEFARARDEAYSTAVEVCRRVDVALGMR